MTLAWALNWCQRTWPTGSGSWSVTVLPKPTDKWPLLPKDPVAIGSIIVLPLPGCQFSGMDLSSIFCHLRFSPLWTYSNHPPFSAA